MKLKVGLAQIKPTLGDLEKNFKIHLDQIARAKKEKCDLLVFPELSLTGYFLRDQVTDVALSLKDPRIQKLAQKSGDLSLVFGFVEQSANAHLYNATAYFEKGKLKHLHRKIYLPTYGLFDEQRYLAEGDRLRAFDTPFGRASILICEDLWHPMLPYTAVLDKAIFLIVPSSSPGRGMSQEKEFLSQQMWEQMNRFYARFFTVFVIYVNRVGFEDGIHFWGGSEIIDPSGKAVAKAPESKEAFVTATLSLSSLTRVRAQNPLLRDEKIDLTLRGMQKTYEEQFKKAF